MIRKSARTAAGIAAAALLVPGAAVATPGHGHGPKEGHGPGIHGKHLAKGHAKPHKLVLKGTVVSVGAAATPTDTTPTDGTTDPTATAAEETPSTDATTVTIHVTKANKHGRSLVGQDVTFTIPEGGVRAADRTGDGTVDLADVNAGDKVLVQTAKLAADAAQPFAGKKLVDQTSPEPEDADDADEAPEAPAPTS
jgi:hypothetical protein